jgi:hypothetical protein
VQLDDLLEQEKFEKSIFVKAAIQLLLDKSSHPTETIRPQQVSWQTLN